MAAIDFGSARSSANPRACAAPSSIALPATASRRSVRRAATASFTPSRASACATASPSPELAPVTSATLPRMPKSIRPWILPPPAHLAPAARLWYPMPVAGTAASRLYPSETILLKGAPFLPLTKENKAEISTKYGRGSNDTGSAEVQIATLTASINHSPSTEDPQEGSS